VKSAIFSLLPVRSGSTIASVRIGRWLSILLGIPLHDDAKILQEGPLDNLFIVNGSTLYCKYLPEIAKAVSEANNVIWVQNDYTLPPPKAESAAESPFRRAFADRGLVPHYWSTCRENAEKTDHSAWVNWNVLGWKDDLTQAKLESDDFLYYGAYRESRALSFAKMYEDLQNEDLVISSTSGKFPSTYLITPLREHFYQQIALYGMGIYAQDAKSAKKMHCPATRFYEMLSVGLPMCFMPDCEETLSHYGMNVAPYVLSDPDSAHELIVNRHSIARTQALIWRKDYIGELTTLVTGLYESLNG
jgi:hypothetical protein